MFFLPCSKDGTGCVWSRLACGGEYASDDAAQSHQELPERHVLLAHGHHQGAGVVLDEDARNAVAARCVVYHPLLREHGKTKRSICHHSPRFVGSLWRSLTLSVTENWCVSADILYVLSLVGTTVMKYWYIWLSAGKQIIKCRSAGETTKNDTMEFIRLTDKFWLKKN